MMKEQKKGAGAVSLALLQIAVLFYSFSTLLTKLAALEEPFSLPFFAMYLGSLVIMGLFAIVWQQFLRKIPLTTAYSSKTVSMVWGVVLGAVFLKEKIRFTMVIGTVIIFIGLYMIFSADRQEAHDGK